MSQGFHAKYADINYLKTWKCRLIIFGTPRTTSQQEKVKYLYADRSSSNVREVSETFNYNVKIVIVLYLHVYVSVYIYNSIVILILW